MVAQLEDAPYKTYFYVKKEKIIVNTINIV